MLAAALNINVTCWRSGPAATDLEHVTIDWMKQILGYPATAGGLLVSGGSMANFAALAAARSAKAPGNVVRDGMAAAGRDVRLRFLRGPLFHQQSGRDARHRRGQRAQRSHQRADANRSRRPRSAGANRTVAAGYRPFCVVANAGTTATGAFDPIGELAAFARRYDLWLHVDAAYGGFAALAPAARPLFAHIAEADSVALDPHKWLYLPVGCGCVLYRDPATAYAAFSHAADYTRAIGLERDEAFAFWDYGPELSRPFRALDLWLLVKYVGAARLAQAVEQNLDCARYFGELVEASGDCELLAPVGLSIFCFRYTPPGYAGDLNALNERILVKLQRAGSSYLSNAMVHGKFALRGCVLNYRTTRRDMEVLLEDVRRAYRDLT